MRKTAAHDDMEHYGSHHRPEDDWFDLLSAGDIHAATARFDIATHPPPKEWGMNC